MFGRSLLSLSRATFAKPIRAPTTAFATPALTRNYMVIVDASDNEDQIRFELGEFANDAQNMGCNSHPYYRRARLTKSDVRKRTGEAIRRKRAYDKVNNLVRMIELQNEYKLR
eukprot:gene7045-5075_t